MKKRKLIILASTIVLLTLTVIGIAFAEYYFIRTVQDGQVELGTIELGDANYLSYAKKNDSGEYTTENVSEPEIISTSTGSIQCYASKKTGFYLEGQSISLSQLGYEFSYKTTVDAYVRIEIQDAWISQKFYSGSKDPNNDYIPKDSRSSYIKATNVTEDNFTKFYTLTAVKVTSYVSGLKLYTLSDENYIDAGIVSEETFNKGTYYAITAGKETTYDASKTYYFNSNSPFSVQNEDWTYVAETGYLYYSQKITGSDTLQTVNFKFDDSYFYPIDEGNVGFIEAILVDLEFNVEIVQANRAVAKWGEDVVKYLK